jgi:hypothetical protein
VVIFVLVASDVIERGLVDVGSREERRFDQSTLLISSLSVVVVVVVVVVA